MKRFLALLALIGIPLVVWAHGGEDHGGATAAKAPGDIAPRASARTEDFELLAVLAGGKLTVYLDRDSDNSPVAGANIEVESGAFKGVAKEVSPALYALPADAFAKPDSYPLTISVQAGETADLLTATLDLTAPEPAVEHVHSWDEWAVWSGAGIVLLAGVGLVVLRRRRMKR